MATAAQQAVLDAYANIGRSGFGDSVANVDQEGYNYWVSQLESGAVTTDQLNDAFGNAVQEYIEDNPDDEYTDHVVNAIVEREYERIGRTGSGDDVSNVDEEGKQYWADQVRQGNVSFNDLDDAFDNAVTEYIEDNPDDEYTDYVASVRPDLAEAGGYTGGTVVDDTVVDDTVVDDTVVDDTVVDDTVVDTSSSGNPIENLADLYYRSMTTGVSTPVIRQAIADAGGDPNDPSAADKILKNAGYSIGDLRNFYTTAGEEPKDPQAKALHDARYALLEDGTNSNLQNLGYLKSKGFDVDTSQYGSTEQQLIEEASAQFGGINDLDSLLEDLSTEEMQRYNELNQLYDSLFGRNIAFEGANYWIRGGGSGAALNEETLAAAALGPDLDYYTTNVLNPRKFQELVGSFSSAEQQRYNQLNALYKRLFGRDIALEGTEYWIRGEGSGAPLTEETLINAAQGEDLDYYNTYVRGTDGTDTGPREATSGPIVPGVPQVGEVGVMDYMGLQAGQPTLPVGTQLAPDLSQLEATDQTLQALTPEQKLDTDADYVASPSEITASTVTAPTAQDAVTATASTTDLVDQPDAAKMTAEKSLDQINKEADALQAARQDLSEIDPKATVQGQLALLQEQFADGEIPVWAQGAFRQVNSLMAQRGIGGSTIAAEAITNALMQSTIPIAQQDASFYQNVTIQNLSNEQQAEMAKFNARTTAIFNDQAAENAARSLNTQSENELAQFFAQLSQNVALTNTAQTNAMEQFNATAKNQTNQFFAELDLTAETFNADAINELATFDAEQANIIAQFNANMKNQREQFNVQNQLAIDASNVQWRRDVNTQNTAATNAALQFDAQNLLAVQQTALNNIWQHYDQLLSFAFTAEESAKDRALNLTISSMNAEMQRQIAEDSSFLDSITDVFGGAATILGSDTGFALAEKWGLI